MASERCKGTSLQVGRYAVTFDEAGADIEQSSTYARYRMQATTAINAVDYVKHHKRLIFAIMKSYPGELDVYRVQPHAEGSNVPRLFGMRQLLSTRPA